MDKQQPQLRVHALPHRGLSLPGWWRNIMLPVSPKREPRATACSAPKQDEGNMSSAEDSGEPFPESRGRSGYPLTLRPFNTSLVMLANATRQEKGMKGTRTGKERHCAAHRQYAVYTENPKQLTSNCQNS